MRRQYHGPNTTLAIVLGTLLSGCGVEATEAITSRGQRVIYGEDDRQELYGLSPVERQMTIAGSVTYSTTRPLPTS